MKIFSKNQLEELFEQMGSHHVPECDEHRYALRRVLLNSRYFSEQKKSKLHHIHVFVPILVSGLAVFIFILGTPNAFVENKESVPVRSISASTIQKNLIATYIDDRPILRVAVPENIVPFSTVAMSMRVE